MDSFPPQQAGIIAALTERLGVLALERDSLARRARELETALSETSQAAQVRASEAVQLQALLDFYRGGREPALTASELERQLPPPELVRDAEVAMPPSVEPTATLPARTAGQGRPTAAWTAAWREAAIAALREHGAPLHYRELYRVVAGRGFTFGGKSPEATFLASLHRDRTTFQGAGKGTYWLVEPVDGETPAVAARTRRRTRRPAPIGRSKAGKK
jgi:hypothetical protein